MPNTLTPEQQSAAHALFDVYQIRKPIEPISQTFIHANDMEAAYAIQRHNTDRWLQQGRCIAGFKVGLTSAAVQKQLGVDQPDFGVLFADMAVVDSEGIGVASVLQPKVEAEVAFLMGKDLDKEQLTVADVMLATEYVVPAIEVLDSRIKDWRITLADTIADNASSGLFVLGNEPRRLCGLNLRNAGMSLTCRGDLLSVGVGVACLGHPLNAVLWLARKLQALGTPIQAGHIVLSGALGPMVPVQMGEVYEADINGLGSVRAAFQGETK